MSGSLVFVTGVSGYLGGQIVHELLKAGYRVRGAVRPAKVAFVQGWYTQYGDRVDIVPLDLTNGDYSTVLKGVDSIVHAAAPLPGREATPKQAIDAAVDGTRRILEQATKTGVKKFALVSSSIALMNPTQMGAKSAFTDKDWNDVTLEEALDPAANPVVVYGAEKTHAEKFAWKFADEHPEVEITTLLPVVCLGPFAPEWRAPEPSTAALSTNHAILDLLKPDGPPIIFPSIVDGRDVARACVLALTGPPTAAVGHKRIILSGAWLAPGEVAAYVAEKRPELKGRISEAWKTAPAAPKIEFDASRAKEVLGLEFTDWRATLLDGVDSVLATEKAWLAQGWVPQTAAQH